MKIAAKSIGAPPQQSHGCREDKTPGTTVPYWLDISEDTKEAVKKMIHVHGVPTDSTQKQKLTKQNHRQTTVNSRH